MTTLEEFLFLLEVNGKEDDKKNKDTKPNIDDLPDDFGEEDIDGTEPTSKDDGTGLPDDFTDEEDAKVEEPKEDKMKVDTNINADKKVPEPKVAETEPKVEPEPTPEPTANNDTSLDIDTPNSTTTPTSNNTDDLDISGDGDDLGDLDLDGDDGANPDDGLGDDTNGDGFGDEEPLDEDEKKEKMRNISVIDNIKSDYKNLKLIEDKISAIIARDAYEQGIIDIINRELKLAVDDTYKYILNVAYNKKYEENLAFLNNIRLIIELIGKNLKIISMHRDDAEKK